MVKGCRFSSKSSAHSTLCWAPLLFSASYFTALIGRRDERETGDGTINQWMKEALNTGWEVLFFFVFLSSKDYPGKEKPICNNSIRSWKTYICSNKVLDPNWFPLLSGLLSSRPGKCLIQCYPLRLPSSLSGCCRRRSTFCACSIFVSLHPCTEAVLPPASQGYSRSHKRSRAAPGDHIFESARCQDWTLTQQPFIPNLCVKLTR